MIKKFLCSFILILIGVFIGGGIVKYYNPSFIKSQQTSLKGQETVCPVNSLGLEKPGKEPSSDLEAARAYIKFKEIKSSFIPSGVPDVYGRELGISFDKVQDAINKVRVFGPTYGKGDKKIVLTGLDLDRYIDIGSKTACQYCCGVKTLVKENGQAACGCAHSIMMRGLAAYLIKNHPEMSNAQILNELNKWKITFFPKQTLSAELVRLEKSGEPGIREILQEFPDFLPQMVGGC